VVKSPDELLSLIYALLCSEDRKPIELSSELRSKISMQASEWSYWDVFQPETVLNKVCEWIYNPLDPWTLDLPWINKLFLSLKLTYIYLET
jgi:hypothetical protein